MSNSRFNNYLSWSFLMKTMLLNIWNSFYFYFFFQKRKGLL
ncbi:hypothetical protein SAMN06265375_1011134 [Muriicola jejuensis]|nr:hypothetical protein SAMN06265375_1011134 [Muriicola jejuensis]